MKALAIARYDGTTVLVSVANAGWFTWRNMESVASKIKEAAE